MAKIIENEKGFRVIEVTMTDIARIGGMGICDWCNGDIYITIQSRNLDGFCTGTHSVRISTSGGNFPQDVKKAAAEFVRALQKHEHAVEKGRYYQYKDVNNEIRR